MEFKSYSTRSDAVRSFKKIHGLEVSPSDHVVKVGDRFQFPLDITPPTSPLSLVDIIPPHLMDTISTKYHCTTVLSLHDTDSFPGRERNIGLWAKLDAERAIAISTHRKTGVQKVIIVRHKN